MPIASAAKAMNIVFSRPMLSETQPKNGRVTPFSTRSIASAKVSAGSVRPRILTGTSAILKSLAIGPSCAVAISPPAATMTNMKYMTQKTGLRSTSIGRKLMRVWGTAGAVDSVAAFFRSAALRTCLGSVNSSEMTNTMIPCPMPK